MPRGDINCQNFTIFTPNMQVHGWVDQKVTRKTSIKVQFVVYFTLFHNMILFIGVPQLKKFKYFFPIEKLPHTKVIE